MCSSHSNCTNALRYWAGWHAARYGIELTLPVPEATVLQFVVDHVVRRAAGGELAWELPLAVAHALVVAGLKVKLGPWTLATVRPRKKTAITLAELEAMLATCDDSLEGLRDRALLCFGSEVAAADLPDLRRIGPQGFIYRLKYSKTQQAGVTATSTPVGDAPPATRSCREKPSLSGARHEATRPLTGSG